VLRLEVLLHAVLDRRRPVPHGAQVPADAALRDQLLATEWGENARGEVALLKKDRLPVSPDEADAVSMAMWARASEYIRPLHLT
jgi:hypothetical protein